MTQNNFFEHAPPHWTRTRLKFLVRDNPTPEQHEALEEAEEASFLPMDAIGEDGSLDLADTRPIDDIASRYTQFFEEDVLLAKITPCFENGKSAIARGLADGVGFGTTELFVLRPREGVLPEYLYYLIRTPDFRQRGEAAMTGAAGQKRVPTEFVQNYQVAVPPVEEQREILESLSHKFDQLGRLVEAKRELVNWLSEKRRSLIAQAVTRGLDEVPMQDSGYPGLGEIPEHWEPMHLKRALKQTDYGTSESTNSEGDIAVLGMGDIGEGNISYDDLSYLDEDEIEDELILQPGDLLFNRTNSLERIAKVALFRGYDDCPVSFASYLVRLRCKEWMDPDYLNYLLNSPQVLAWARGNAIPAIGQANLSPRRYGYLPIAVPPLDEQKEIVEFIDEETRKLKRVSKGTGQTIDLLEERRRSLITAAVTGQLDVGVPA
jgi:type I restriction enzyme S subunit